MMRFRSFCCVLLAVFGLVEPLTSADSGQAGGQAMTEWVQADGAAPGSGWEIADGVLHRTAKAGDLFSKREYGDFTLDWEWKISPGGNSGLKYRVMKYGEAMLGPEYQMLDDAKHADGLLPSHRSAAIYDLFPPADDKPLKPVGEWNSSRVVVRGTSFEHWLNGVKVAECDTATPTWETAFAKSKFHIHPNWAKNPKGRILLQDHGDEVWFRHLRIKEE